MPTSWGKVIGWALLFLGTGGTCLFIMIAVIVGNLPRGEIVWLWLWPTITVAMVIGAAFHLRRSYHSEPSPWLRWFHFGLLDITLATVGTGVCIGWLHSLVGRQYLCFALPASIAAGAFFLFGTSLASGAMLSGLRRYSYALGYTLIGSGLLAMSGLVVLIGAVLLTDGPSQLTLFLGEFVSEQKPDFYFLRPPLLWLPLGLLIRWLALRGTPTWSCDEEQPVVNPCSDQK